MLKKTVGLLWDSVSNNIGDQAIGLTLKKICDSRKIDYRVINPFDFRVKDYSTIVIGGGELIRKQGDLFYDRFRIPGNHILNVVGTHQPTDLNYLVDYKLISVRSKNDKKKLIELVPNINVDVKPCTTVLMQDLFPEIELPGKQLGKGQPIIGVHINAASYKDLPNILSELEKVNKKYKIVLFPFTLYQNDEEFLKSINLYLPNASIFSSVDPLEVFKGISTVDLMVSTSLHAGIFAYVQGKQLLSYPIYPKIKNFFTDRKLSSFLFSRNDDLLARVEALLESPIEYATKIAEDKSQVFEHLDHIEECIKNDQETKIESKRLYSNKKSDISSPEVFHQLTHSNIKLSVDLIAKNLQNEFHERQLRKIVDLKEESILQEQKTIQRLNDLVEGKEEIISQKEIESSQNRKFIQLQEDKISNLQNALSKLEGDLYQIKSSKAYRTGLFLRKIKILLLPRIISKIAQKSISENHEWNKPRGRLINNGEKIRSGKLLFHIDTEIPKQISIGKQSNFDIKGWCFHTTQKIINLEILINNRTITVINHSYPRDDVLNVYKDIYEQLSYVLHSGFDCFVPIIKEDISKTINISLKISLANGEVLQEQLGGISVVNDNGIIVGESSQISDIELSTAEDILVVSDPSINMPFEQKESSIVRAHFNWITIILDYLLIKANRCFDPKFYLSSYPDVRNSSEDPLMHFVKYGWREGRNPSSSFDTQQYLSVYPDVRDSDINPLVHYLTHGKKEGRGGIYSENLPKKDLKVNASFIENQNIPTNNIRHLKIWKNITGSQSAIRKNKIIISIIKRFKRINTAATKAVSTDNRQQLDIDIPYKSFYEENINVSTANKSKDYVEIIEAEDPTGIADVKLIAFYLPQYHPIPENDQWWGRGFTEWTNVSKAVSQFEGHYQPRLPGELGFYDLRIPEVQRRQVELARKYGIYGFCFHYYWFGGKRLLERPLWNFINDPNINFPFCICWANENWTRRWDGQEDDILIAQEHNFENDKNFIADLEQILQNPNYIKINGRPLIIVYRATLLKDPIRTEKFWREFCQEHGLGNPLLVAAQTFGFSDPTKIGFDAAVEFPPHNINYSNIKPTITMLNPHHTGAIYDYREMVTKNLLYRPPGYKLFKTVTPGWDNEARKPGQGSTFINSSPERYRQWLSQVCVNTIQTQPIEERVVFINAWNEWAEGAYLEPDRKYGYAYLQATLDAIKNAGSIIFQTKDGSNVVNPQRRHKTAVVLHIYYQELFSELANYLKNLNDDFDLYVSIPSFQADFKQTVFQAFPGAYIFFTNNRGRDIAPFIDIYRAIGHSGYDSILKLHTKKSLHRQDGDAWRNDILTKLIGSKESVNNIKQQLNQNAKFGIIGAKGHVLDHRIYWGFNKGLTLNLAKEVGIVFSSDPEFPFVAGSMFWAKPEAFRFLDILPINSLDFEPEPIPPDGTLAHAIERLFGLAAKAAGLLILEIDSEGNISEPGEGNMFAFAQPYPQ